MHMIYNEPVNPSMTNIFDACDVICGTSDSLTAISKSKPTPPSLIILLLASSDDMARFNSNDDAQNCSSVLSCLNRFSIIFTHPASTALLWSDSTIEKIQLEPSGYLNNRLQIYCCLLIKKCLLQLAVCQIQGCK